MSEVTVVARIHPKPGKEDEVARLLVEMAAAVRASEPDCLVYRPHRSAKEPVVFLFYEQYRSREAFDVHRKAPHLAHVSPIEQGHDV
ncbi:MAG: antibiotic biosynthesis monooxygenase [Chloroflexi bacterium]|nr:antibiotic biosynthesis monooxygenase [Chloroflexota bacterium]